MGQNLDPIPTNFHESELMGQISPFQVYNTIKLDVNGTGMRSFSELTEAQLWGLAFYVKSLRFGETETDTTTLRAHFNKAISKVTLKEVATLSDKQLLKILEKKKRQPYFRIKSASLIGSNKTRIK